MTRLPSPIAAYIAAYNAKDVAAMLAQLSEDVVFEAIDGGGVTTEARGKAAFAELAHFAVEAFTSRRQEVTNAITVADTTLAEITYTAVVARDLPNGWTAGQDITLTGASSFRLRDGRITHLIDES
jgi:hypothetical protein